MLQPDRAVTPSAVLILIIIYAVVQAIVYCVVAYINLILCDQPNC